MKSFFLEETESKIDTNLSNSLNNYNYRSSVNKSSTKDPFASKENENLIIGRSLGAIFEVDNDLSERVIYYLKAKREIDNLVKETKDFILPNDEFKPLILKDNLVLVLNFLKKINVSVDAMIDSLAKIDEIFIKDAIFKGNTDVEVEIFNEVISSLLLDIKSLCIIFKIIMLFLKKNEEIHSLKEHIKRSDLIKEEKKIVTRLMENWKRLEKIKKKINNEFISHKKRNYFSYFEKICKRFKFKDYKQNLPYKQWIKLSLAQKEMWIYYRNAWRCKRLKELEKIKKADVKRFLYFKDNFKFYEWRDSNGNLLEFNKAFLKKGYNPKVNMAKIKNEVWNQNKAKFNKVMRLGKKGAVRSKDIDKNGINDSKVFKTKQIEDKILKSNFEVRVKKGPLQKINAKVIDYINQEFSNNTKDKDIEKVEDSFKISDIEDNFNDCFTNLSVERVIALDYRINKEKLPMSSSELNKNAEKTVFKGNADYDSIFDEKIESNFFPTQKSKILNNNDLSDYDIEDEEKYLNEVGVYVDKYGLEEVLKSIFKTLEKIRNEEIFDDVSNQMSELDNYFLDKAKKITKKVIEKMKRENGFKDLDSIFVDVEKNDFKGKDEVDDEFLKRMARKKHRARQFNEEKYN